MKIIFILLAVLVLTSCAPTCWRRADGSRDDAHEQAFQNKETSDSDAGSADRHS